MSRHVQCLQNDSKWLCVLTCLENQQCLKYLWGVNAVLNGTIAFIGSQWSIWDETWLFVHVIPLAPVLASKGANCTENDIVYSLSQDNWNEVQLGHVMPLALVSVSHDADGIINGTIPFLIAKWLNELINNFRSYAATGIDISSMWCWWYCQWHHCIC